MTKAPHSTVSRSIQATSEDAPVADRADMIDIGYDPRTDLGRLALAARREYFAAGGKPLSRDEINEEVARRRGGTHLLDNR